MKSAVQLQMFGDRLREDRLQLERDKAFQRGFEDAGRGVPRKRPPYGFTDLREAWRKGWDKRSKRAAS